MTWLDLGRLEAKLENHPPSSAFFFTHEGTYKIFLELGYTLVQEAPESRKYSNIQLLKLLEGVASYAGPLLPPAEASASVQGFFFWHIGKTTG